MIFETVVFIKRVVIVMASVSLASPFSISLYVALSAPVSLYLGASPGHFPLEWSTGNVPWDFLWNYTFLQHVVGRAQGRTQVLE